MKMYTVDVYFKYDPKEERTEIFGVDADSLEEVIEFVKEREDYEIIDYFTVSDDNGDLYNSSKNKLTMKQVKIRINGDLVFIDYCSQKVIDESIKTGDCKDEADAFASNYYIICGWNKVEALYVDDNEEENLIKAKGKYENTREFFHKLFAEDGDHPLPVKIHYRYYYEQELEYVIELEDDEEFDIKKVQLVKSDEISEFPYFILCDYILYNGKEIEANPGYNDLEDYCPEDESYNEDEVEYFAH